MDSITTADLLTAKKATYVHTLDVKNNILQLLLSLVIKPLLL